MICTLRSALVVLMLSFVGIFVSMFCGCAARPKALPTAVLAPQVSQLAAASAVAAIAPACPAGMQSVGAVTALAPNFQMASIPVTYFATNDGQGTAIPCVAAMPARENSASSSAVPAPQ